MEGTKAFSAQAHEVAEQPPERVATDGHRSYSRRTGRRGRTRDQGLQGKSD
ncbi:hypothetical protein IFO70_23680 [Phormidium tenue FACHB-886]|nr:hypothetical protein [Phormidium tenue FACHB-886]